MTTDKPRLYKTEAVVLKHIPLGEADRIVTLFTPDLGIVRASAKGVRRPRSRIAGHLEPLVRCRLMLARGRNLDIISGAETLQGFTAVREDLEQLGRAMVCVELVDAFSPEGQANRPLYDLLVEALEWLESGEGDWALRFFEFHLLGLTGYMPELHRCVGCEGQVQPGEHAFSPGLGGVLCRSCVEGGLSHLPPERAAGPIIPLSLDALKVLRYVQGHPYQEVRRIRLDAPLARGLERLLRGYTSYLLERGLRAPEFLEGVRRLG